MPLVWRGMRMADARPEIGRSGNTLGVRVGPAPGDDIPENGGFVYPGTGGMSVSPTLEAVPAHRLPRRLRGKFPARFPDARGPNQLHCWSTGEGEFLAGPFIDRLAFRPDPRAPDRHGLVEPEITMSVDDYEAAITATRDHWTRWEE